MKNLLLIFAMFISSIAFAQECTPDCPDPVVFEFDDCSHETDGVVDALDRLNLLETLGNINITLHYFTNPPDFINGAHDLITIKDSYNALVTSFFISGIKLEESNYDYGEQQIKDLTPENFKKLYIDIENITINL